MKLKSTKKTGFLSSEGHLLTSPDCCPKLQYRSKVSYHPLVRRELRLERRDSRLERRDFRLERRESRLARVLKNWKYGCLNFSWDFSSLMLTVQQQRSKTLRYLTLSDEASIVM